MSTIARVTTQAVADATGRPGIRISLVYKHWRRCEVVRVSTRATKVRAGVADAMGRPGNRIHSCINTGEGARSFVYIHGRQRGVDETRKTCKVKFKLRAA